MRIFNTTEMIPSFKQMLLAFAFLSLAHSAFGQSNVLRVSPFMMPPKETWTPHVDSADPNVTITEHLPDEGELGFRVIHLRSSVKARKQAAIDLARSGLIQTGDILLSFRPLWDRTLAYAHMQLGISHSAIAFIVSDAETGEEFVMTLESPISYSSPLNYPQHYSDLDVIHVIRPSLDETQTRNLEKWARLVLNKQDRFEFFTDYSKPMYTRGIGGVETPEDQIKLLAEVLIDTSQSKFVSYCSEFVWSFLGLRNCSPDVFNANCITPLFGTSNGMMTGIFPKMAGNAGLVQGPEAALTGGNFSTEARKSRLTESIFVDVVSNPSDLEGRMSAGHRKVAAENREGMKIINGYYANGELEAIASAVNEILVDNVSPTSFLIRSNSKLDGLRYVGSIVFDR